MDFYGFYMGEEFEAWRYLGAQVSSHGTTFRTFAPNALRISLIGDFNQIKGSSFLLSRTLV